LITSTPSATASSIAATASIAPQLAVDPSGSS